MERKNPSQSNEALLEKRKTRQITSRILEISLSEIFVQIDFTPGISRISVESS